MPEGPHRPWKGRSRLSEPTSAKEARKILLFIHRRLASLFTSTQPLTEVDFNTADSALAEMSTHLFATRVALTFLSAEVRVLRHILKGVHSDNNG